MFEDRTVAEPPDLSPQPHDVIPDAQRPNLLRLLARHWGYDAFLPSQESAIAPILAGRDTLVIMPTGGGKSLVYQLPALALEGTALIVSPLLALMKDQVDGLIRAGIPAAALNSTLSAEERRRVSRDFASGVLKLLYVSPEGLATERLLDTLNQGKVSFIAIDEAHCISQWGHDYRADYRALGKLRDLFPGAAMHAFTATATPIVRDDIVGSLRMRDPARVVGSFVRANLTYRTVYRHDALAQIKEVIARHPGDAGIVYAIKRKDVEELAEALQKAGIRALPYHAGLDPTVRRRNQEQFSNEDVEVVVATVAFGMGIDRSNVRYVVHAGLPRSIEHYQQEAGRAGRDRLPSECVLIYSAQDLLTWRHIISDLTGAVAERAQQKLREIYRYGRMLTCRHRFLVEYFGEPYTLPSCGACDVCLDEHAVQPDSVVTAQKLLSGVARLQERFGGHYVADVLRGAKTDKITHNGHDRLTTYGLLKEHPGRDLLDWLDQLVGLGYLERWGDYQTLSITPEGRFAMRGERPVKLSLPRRGERKSKRDKRDPGATVPHDESLFAALRAWRRELARTESIPPYLIFSDAALIEISAARPSTLVALLRCKGVGSIKLERYGDAVLAVVAGTTR